MENRSNVVKSKSSNSAIQTKSDIQRNKKSRSNAGFQPLLQVKKRGVYVEKKPTKVSLNAGKYPGTQKEAIQPPPRPRPGKKNFLASVLTILSKSTTGTQCPDSDINTILDNNRDTTVKRTRKKKHYFKSKVLRNNNYQEDILFEVIQPKKEMIPTPSIFSEFSNKSYRPDQSVYFDKPSDNDLKSVKEDKNSQLVREVLEGRMLNEKITAKIEEPATLVSEKDEKGLYNFFVDLLETTFSGCSVKTALDVASHKSSKVAFAIDENVAKKLIVAPNAFEEETEILNYPQNEQEWNDDQEFNYFQTSVSAAKTNVRPKKKRTKSQSFSFANQHPFYPQRTVKPRKKFSRKTYKRDLLNVLKEELKMDVALEEPQNLYQALKIMANNKKKSQKSLRFDDSTNIDECIYKRRKLLTSKQVSKTKSVPKDHDYSFRPMSRRGTELRKHLNYEESIEGSSHSLEVFELDYEYPHKITSRIDEKDMLLTYHSSSDSDSFDPDDFNSECRSEMV